MRLSVIDELPRLFVDGMEPYRNLPIVDVNVYRNGGYKSTTDQYRTALSHGGEGCYTYDDYNQIVKEVKSLLAE